MQRASLELPLPAGANDVVLSYTTRVRDWSRDAQTLIYRCHAAALLPNYGVSSSKWLDQKRKMWNKILLC